MTRLPQISVTSTLYLASKHDVTFRGTFLVVAENCGRVVKNEELGVLQRLKQMCFISDLSLRILFLKLRELLDQRR